MEENNKNKRKSIAEWIAVFLCIAAAPVPCITLMSATKVLSERWECMALWPALLCLVIGAIAFLITCRVLSWLIYLIIKQERSKCYERMSYYHNHIDYTICLWRNCFSCNCDNSTAIAWRTGCKKPGRPSLVHMDCNYHSTDYITKDSCQSKSHYCKLYL